MRTFRSSTNTTTRRVTVADRTGWTTCNWYTGGVIMGTTRGSGARRPRLEPDDEQSSRPVLRGLGSGNGARLPDIGLPHGRRSRVGRHLRDQVVRRRRRAWAREWFQRAGATGRGNV